VPEGASLLDASGLAVNAALNQWQGKTYFLCPVRWAVEYRKRPDTEANKVLKFVLLNQSRKGAISVAQARWRIGWLGRIVPRPSVMCRANDETDDTRTPPPAILWPGPGFPGRDVSPCVHPQPPASASRSVITARPHQVSGHRKAGVHPLSASASKMDTGACKPQPLW
jgi:hypothetical protein